MGQPLEKITMPDGDGFIELLDVMGSDLDIVNAARVSYLGESKGEEKDKKLLFYLMKHRHTTPFEMVEYKFRIYCPLFVARQWMRHRTWSYNEVSRRYTSESIEFYSPANWHSQDSDNKQGSAGIIGEANAHMAHELLYNHNADCLRRYYRLLELGVVREQARMVLPQNLFTMFHAKVDLHNLLHFIKLRADKHAQWEIRQYAIAILRWVKQYNPWVYESAIEHYFSFRLEEDQVVWPRIRDLPEEERVPFAQWLVGQTVPYLENEPQSEQDAYYPWDYEAWKTHGIIFD